MAQLALMHLCSALDVEHARSLSLHVASGALLEQRVKLELFMHVGDVCNRIALKEFEWRG